MTLHEAKNEVARKFDYGDWEGLVKTHRELQIEYDIQPDFIDDVAELYASSLRSELAEKEKELSEQRKEVIEECIGMLCSVFPDYGNQEFSVRGIRNILDQLKNTKP